MGRGGVARQVTRNDMRWRLSLSDPALMRPAGLFGRRVTIPRNRAGHDIQPFADILADDMTLSSASAGPPGPEDHLNPFQRPGP